MKLDRRTKAALEKDFDYSYLLELMLFKLRKMQAFFESDDAMCIDALEISNEIKSVADALQRYLDDDYCNTYYEVLQTHCGKIQMRFKPYNNELDEFDGFYFDNCDNQKRALCIWRKLNERAEDLKQQDFEFVFNTLKEKLQNWWD